MGGARSGSGGGGDGGGGGKSLSESSDAESEARRAREAEAAKLEEAKTEIGWGRQIRSYVLQPYQMVKDLRTGHQTSDTQGVLDGDLDPFMAASLAQRVSGGGEAPVEDIE